MEKTKTQFRLGSLFTLFFLLITSSLFGQSSTNMPLMVNLNLSLPAQNSGFFGKNIKQLTNAITTNGGLNAIGISAVGSVAGQVMTSGGSSVGWTSLPNANYVNILLYGGVEDGATDNSQAFSNACAAAGTYGTVYMPHTNTGTTFGYKVHGNIYITNNYLTVLGDGIGQIFSAGIPSSFKTVILWTNINSNCFIATGRGVQWNNLSAYWTNSTVPTAGAFCVWTTNSDPTNGSIWGGGNNFLADGGYRQFDWQALFGPSANNCSFVRWYQDAIRINNYANFDVGGWGILNSQFEAYGSGLYPSFGSGGHIANSAIRWEGGGAGTIENCTFGAFNWGGYQDNGGVNYELEIQPEGITNTGGTATSGCTFYIIFLTITPATEFTVTQGATVINFQQCRLLETKWKVTCQGLMTVSV